VTSRPALIQLRDGLTDAPPASGFVEQLVTRARRRSGRRRRGVLGHGPGIVRPGASVAHPSTHKQCLRQLAENLGQWEQAQSARAALETLRTVLAPAAPPFVIRPPVAEVTR
jgi:hypothetical protein